MYIYILSVLVVTEVLYGVCDYRCQYRVSTVVRWRTPEVLDCIVQLMAEMRLIETNCWRPYETKVCQMADVVEASVFHMQR
jgi:hypothetical protein